MGILRDIFPKEWKDQLDMNDTYIEEFRNLQHFKYEVSKLRQKEDTACGVSYADAVTELLEGRAAIPRKEYDIIKNRVKQSLLKRGLISDTVYESYKYDVQGDIWDVSKVIAQDPMCCLVPNETYTNYFYELYISISYPYYVSNSTVIENMAKILATVELLEQEHYYCKLSLVIPNKGCNLSAGESNYLGIIPLFSHKDVKTIETMSSVLNERLLRKFFFAIWENKYGNSLARGYGKAIDLEYTIKPVDLDEVELATSIIDKIITPCERRF